jgi:hypothetical protein
MNTIKTGYIVFLPRFAGSKAERLYPCLIQSELVTDWVRHQADDPFNHRTLKPYHLKYVEVAGDDSGDGVFRVKAIKEIPPPYPPTSADVLH